MEAPSCFSWLGCGSLKVKRVNASESFRAVAAVYRPSLMYLAVLLSFLPISGRAPSLTTAQNVVLVHGRSLCESTLRHPLFAVTRVFAISNL